MNKFPILIAMAISLPSAAFCAESAEDLLIKISLIEGENSKDKHATVKEIMLDKQHLTYHKTYTGFMRDKGKNIQKTMEINSDSLSEIKTVSKKMQQEKDQHPAMKIQGVGRYCILSSEIRLEGKTANTRLEGMMKQVEKTAAYQHTQALIRIMEAEMDM